MENNELIITNIEIKRFVKNVLYKIITFNGKYKHIIFETSFLWNIQLNDNFKLSGNIVTKQVNPYTILNCECYFYTTVMFEHNDKFNYEEKIQQLFLDRSHVII